MIIHTYSSLLLTILLLIATLQANSQNTDNYKYPPSEVLTIHSQILKEDRKVYVSVPKLDSADVNKRFPVLYIMDADNHFGLLAQYVDYLSRPDVLAMPKMIVVGITNTDRTRDLTPTNSMFNYEGKLDTASWNKSSGGNENFLQFIQAELMPMIDKNYKTEPYRIFAGHSFGGITAINCMLTHPDMFDAYIAVSPSFWWDKNYVLKLAEKNLKVGSKLNKKLFYSDGNEGGPNSFFHKDLLKFDALISRKKLKGLKHLYKHYPSETHMTEPIVAYFDALRFIFKEWEKKED
ncbi:MAG: alpha/beta hydrolase [Leadbetterella sp.]